MLSLNNKISIRQLQVLLILDVFGTGVTFLPQVVSNFAGQDGWICVIIATGAVMFFAYIIASVASLFPDKTFLEYTSKLLSKPMGVIISVLFVIKIALTSAFNLRFFGEIVRQTLLSETPFSVICIGMLLLGAYAAAKGYETRARIAEILIFIVILPIVFIVAIASSDADFTNLLPVLASSPSNILNGSYAAVFAFTGFDFCLLAYPYLHRPKHARKSIIYTVIVIGALMTIVTAVSISRFGPFELNRQMWPVLGMMDTATLPGSFLERQGALVMSFWIISVFAAVNAGLFFSSLLLRDVCKKGNHSTYILILIPIIFGISLLPENIVELFRQYHFVNNTLGIAYLFFIPLLLLITAKLKKAGEPL